MKIQEPDHYHDYMFAPEDSFLRPAYHLDKQAFFMGYLLESSTPNKEKLNLDQKENIQVLTTGEKLITHRHTGM